MVRFDDELAALLRTLPQSGPLFPNFGKLREAHRATEFKRRCRRTGIVGVTLHSFRIGLELQPVSRRERHFNRPTNRELIQMLEANFLNLPLCFNQKMRLGYEFDTAIRDRGETPPVRLTAQQLNDSLAAKFEPLKKFQPSPTRLREILALAQRKNLLRFTPDTALERSVIEVFPTLKRVIPFQSIEEWNKNAERYLVAAKEAGADTAALPEDSEGDKDE